MVTSRSTVPLSGAVTVQDRTSRRKRDTVRSGGRGGEDRRLCTARSSRGCPPRDTESPAALGGHQYAFASSSIHARVQRMWARTNGARACIPTRREVCTTGTELGWLERERGICSRRGRDNRCIQSAVLHDGQSLVIVLYETLSGRMIGGSLLPCDLLFYENQDVSYHSGKDRYHEERMERNLFKITCWMKRYSCVLYVHRYQSRYLCIHSHAFPQFNQRVSVGNVLQFCGIFFLFFFFFRCRSIVRSMYILILLRIISR